MESSACHHEEEAALHSAVLQISEPANSAAGSGDCRPQEEVSPASVQPPSAARDSSFAPETSSSTLKEQLAEIAEFAVLSTKQHSAVQESVERLSEMYRHLNREFGEYKESTARVFGEQQKEITSLKNKLKRLSKAQTMANNAQGGLPNRPARAPMRTASSALSAFSAVGADADAADAVDAENAVNAVKDVNDDDAGVYFSDSSEELDEDCPPPKDLDTMNRVKSLGGKCCATKVELYYAKDRRLLTCDPSTFCTDKDWGDR